MGVFATYTSLKVFKGTFDLLALVFFVKVIERQRSDQYDCLR